MARQPNLMPLKVLVISLGFVLVGGTVFLFAAIASKAGKEIRSTRCAGAVFHTQGLGTVTSAATQGDTVEITLANPPETTLLSVDRCSGKTLHSFTVEP